MFNNASDPGLREEIVGSSLRTPQRVMHRAIASAFAEQEALGGPLSVPSLFLRAATQYATEDEIRAHLPGVHIAEVDCAHFLQLEKPEELNGILERFLGGDHVTSLAYGCLDRTRGVVGAGFASCDNVAFTERSDPAPRRSAHD